MKMCYLEAENKHIVQATSLKSSQYKIYGLGGPNINEYVARLKSMGYTDITSFENKRYVYDQQVLDKPECTLIYGNILDNLKGGRFLDLDLCCCITSIEKYLPNILKLPEFSLTLSVRIGFDKTLDIFRKYGDCHYMYYQDTVPMITFFKSKIYNNVKRQKVNSLYTSADRGY